MADLITRDRDHETNVSPDSNTNSTVSMPTPPMSRRRLVFRPPVSKVKPLTYEKNGTTEDNSNSASDVINNKSAISDGLVRNQPAQALAAMESADQQKSQRRIIWSFQESMFFYEAVKQNGKDFDSIAKYLNKKKVRKDKEQVRNYYFNAHKIWKSKAQLEETDWQNVPRDARELFVVLNGCEWRKRTAGANFNANRFRTLILEGVVSVRLKRKKSLIMIRTPHCPALLKFFPYDKRNAEIPTHLSLKLTPLHNQDRNFVCSCEQNPFLQLQLNVNDKISNVFDFLKKKWRSQVARMAADLDVCVRKTMVKLRVEEKTSIYKIHVDISDDQNTLMSLRRLKRDYDAEQTLTDFMANGNLDMETAGSSSARQKDSGSNLIKLNGATLKEVFNINEDKIREGLTEENVGNASVLQLFYLFGMKTEISLSYEICEPRPSPVQPWNTFLSLIHRDYDELMAKSSVFSTLEQPPSSKSCSTPAAVAESSRQVLPSSSSSNPIMDEENNQFLRQLQQMNNPSNKRPKRQVKLVLDSQKSTYKRLCPVLPRRSTPSNFNQNLRFMTNNNIGNLALNNAQSLIYPNPASLQPVAYLTNSTQQQQHYTVIDTSHQDPTPPSFVSAQHVTVVHQNPPINPTDFSHLVAPVQSFSQQIPIKVFGQMPSSTASLAQNTVHVLNATADFSMDSTTQFHAPIVIDCSPSKSLPDDVRHTLGQMLNQNSVDFCKNFEQLTSQMDHSLDGKRMPSDRAN